MRSATKESLSPDGDVTPELIKLYTELAEEVGLIITGAADYLYKSKI